MAARRFSVPTLIVTGALCGVAAALFHRFVEAARLALIGGALHQHGVVREIAVVGTPVIVFTLIAIGIRRFAPGAVGANLARVRMAYNTDPALLGKRSVLATFLTTPLSLGAGAPLGPEGPIVVISSGIAVALGRALKLPRRLRSSTRRSPASSSRSKKCSAAAIADSSPACSSAPSPQP